LAEVKYRGSAVPRLSRVALSRSSKDLCDNIEVPDIFGIKGLQKEPVGLASIESLKARPSRRFTLDQLLGHYAQEEFKEERAERLRD